MSEGKILKEIALELLEKYRLSETGLIWEISGSISEDIIRLEYECNYMRKQIEKAAEPKWIPVAERLPEKSKENCDYYFSPIRSKDVKAEEYIVMIDGAKIPTALYWDGEYWFDEQECRKTSYNVTAWMPLPDAYDGGEQE